MKNEPVLLDIPPEIKICCLTVCNRRKREDCAPTEDPQAVHVGVEHRVDREGKLVGADSRRLTHNNELVVL